MNSGEPIWCWWGIGLLIAVALVLFFFRLGGYGLLDPDEPVYGETAREMMVLRDWMSPYMNFKPWFDKPIFFYWLTILSFKLFGISEFAARFWSALFALAGTLLTYRFSLLLYRSRRQALLAALVLEASFGYVVMARASVTDMTLTFFMSAALFSFYWGMTRPGYRRAYWWTYVFCALGALTKGPMGVALPFGIIGSFLILTGRLSEIRRMRPILGGILLLAVAAPWYVAMYWLHGVEFGNTFLVQYNLGRFLKPEHSHRSYFYYVPVLILGLFPWGLFFLVMLVRSIKRWRDNRLLFPLIWFSFIFIFFTAAESKLPSYILPVFPAAALLLGYFWSEASGATSRDLSLQIAACGTPFLGAALFALPFFPTELLERFPAAVRSAALLGGGLSTIGIVVLILLIRRRWAEAFGFQILLMTLFVPALLLAVMPKVERYGSTKELAQQTADQSDARGEVASFRYYRPSMTFYSRRVIQKIDDEPALARFLGADRKVYCFIKEEHLLAFQRSHPETPVHRLQSSAGLVLISNQG